MTQTAARQAIASPGPRELRPPPVAVKRPWPAKLALMQGACLLAFSARRSTSAALAMANVAGAMMYAGLRGEVRRPLRTLGATMSATFGAIDLSRGRTLQGLVLIALAAALPAVEARDVLRRRRQPEAAFA